MLNLAGYAWNRIYRNLFSTQAMKRCFEIRNMISNLVPIWI